MEQGVVAVAAHGFGRKLQFLVVGIVIGTGIGLTVPKNAQPQVSGEDAEASETVMTVVEYPFGYSTEGWSLVLCEMDEDHMCSGRELRLYDETGKLVQVIPCSMEAEALTFRFDRLFHYY